MFKKEIEKLIENYEKKAEAAEANYRDTGYDRYYNAVQRYVGVTSFLRKNLESQERAERGDKLQFEIDAMASEIREFRYLSPQRREDKINDIFVRIENLSRS
ncbi:MAG: hypothetical protein J6S14_04920 [Clostridia bacterium]|nr:hypothetical protein [Clostridia bacterium]